jgi:hypothetical protein
MMSDELDRLERLAEARHGLANSVTSVYQCVCGQVGGGRPDDQARVLGHIADEHGRFIVAARDALPRLIAVARAAEAASAVYCDPSARNRSHPTTVDWALAEALRALHAVPKATGEEP